MKKNKIIIEDPSFFEDLIWMSYRYCIGRKTIAAHYHACNIAKYIDKLPENRIEFMAKDIRSCINNVIRFSSNVYDNGFSDNYDACSLIFKYLLDHPEIEDDTKYEFFINTNTGEVDAKPINEGDKKTYRESLYLTYTDLSIWVKLANYLDKKCHVKVKVKNGDEIQELEAFPAPIVWQKDIKFVYIGVESFKSNPIIINYINPEAIIEVKKYEEANAF